MGFTQVNKDQGDRVLIQAYIENGGSVQRVPASAHGTCERRKGLQFQRERKAVDPNYEQSKRDLMADPSIRCEKNEKGFYTGGFSRYE